MNTRLYLLCLLCLFVNACSNSESGGKKILHINESKNISTLDPAYARNQILMRPVMQLFNGLLQLDKNLNVKPCIASRWAISSDGLRYTFFLRNDVFFHDHPFFDQSKGRRVVASDFVYSFNRLLDEQTASPGRWIFNMVDKDKKGTEQGFLALNDSTLEIYLTSPFPGFLGILTMPYCSVVPKEIVKHYGADFGRNPVGTGAFRLKKWRENEKLVMVKNDNYFETDSLNRRLPYLDAITITFVSDIQSEFMEFMKGRFDMIIGVNPSFKDELISRNGQQNPRYASKIVMKKSPYLNTEYLAFQLDSSKLKPGDRAILDKRVRQAINYAIDRRKMILFLRNNIGKPAEYGFVPLGLPEYRNERIKGFSYNPNLSRQLLREAGYADGKGLPRLTLTTTTDYADLCEFVQHELSEVGIGIDIEVANGATYKEMVANSKVSFFRGSWVADYPDPENYLSLFYSKNFSPQGPNYTHYSNKYFDTLYRQAVGDNSFKARNELYMQMDSMLMADAVIVPLFYDEALIFISKKIEGLDSNPLNTLNLKVVNLSIE